MARARMTRAVRHLFVKELIELRADPRLFGIVIIAPILQLTILGYAATTDVKNVPIVFVDPDRSVESRELITRFEASDNFTVVDVLDSTDQIDDWLDGGRAWMALSIQPDYGRRIAGGNTAAIQVIADGTDSNSTTVALSYARTLVAGYAQELRTERTGVPPLAPITVSVRVWFNPDLESRVFMIPGIVAMLLLVITTNLSAMAIVREKELGTLEQLNVTPIARWELILGKLLPYALVGMLDVVLVLIVAIVWFEVPMRGSLLLLFAMSSVYLLTTLGLGLFVSTISATQQQASMTTVFFFLTPMMYLSGFIFPIENMPDWIQPLTFLIPLRYFLVILRGIFLKGVGLEVLWPQALALLVWGVAIVTLATLRSSKRLA
jgi:ABC-2 type transport system permease protein